MMKLSVVFSMGMLSGFAIDDRHLTPLGLLGISFGAFYLIVDAIQHRNPSPLVNQKDTPWETQQ